MNAAQLQLAPWLLLLVVLGFVTARWLRARLLAGGLWPSSQATRRGMWFLFGGLCLVGGLMWVVQAHAQASEAMRSLLDTQIKEFVDKVVSDSGNGLNWWARSVMLTLTVILIATQIATFVVKGFDPIYVVEGFTWLSLTSVLYFSYSSFCAGVWSISIGIGDAMQMALVGNTDDLFMVQWLTKSLSSISLDGADIFDDVGIFMHVALWYLIVLALQVVGWIVGLWGYLGNALCQLIGLMFVPFLMLKSTRDIFDGWLKLFIGFVMLNIVLKATMVLTCLVAKSTFQGLGVKWAGNWSNPSDVVHIAKESFYLVNDATAMLLICIMFVCGAFFMSGKLSAGVGSVGGGMEKAVSNMAARAAVKLFTGV